MWKWIGEILKRPVKFRHVIYALMLTVGVFLAAAALRMILSDITEDTAARVEYLQLREDFHTVSGTPTPVIRDVSNEESDEEADEDEEEDNVAELRSMSLDELAAINRDFIGWINAGNAIDYPVVRGNDNSRYINLTFHGSRNSAGTIFMDYRNSKGFDEQVAILYGHHTRDGSMFSALINYLNPSYMQNNPNINITTRDGRTLTYRVFAATQTDAWDTAYSVGIHEGSRASEEFPDAPSNASRFLLLSTCTRSSNDDERILVFAALS